MTENIVINDYRDKFKLNTFSNYKKKNMSKNIQNAIYYNKEEESFFWTAEMLCSDMLLELWESYYLLMSRYIHNDNPKLPLYIMKKYEEFRELVSTEKNIVTIRNNSQIRVIFFSITTVLCNSQKRSILDDLKCVFVFKIETLYDNLKAPKIDYVNPFYRDFDPKEYLVPCNEFIYHLTVTKSKVDIVYWINWIIEYDILCRKKQKNVLCETRKEIYSNSRRTLEGNIIWMIWEIVLKVSNDVVNEMFQNIINSILRLFSTRYTLTTNKKRIFMIYHAIEILLFYKDIKINTPIVDKTNCFNHLEKNISVIFEQIKEKEMGNTDAPSSNNMSKIDIYQNIYMTL